jgi:hypothetical protein
MRPVDFHIHSHHILLLIYTIIIVIIIVNIIIVINIYNFYEVWYEMEECPTSITDVDAFFNSILYIIKI